VAIPTARRRVPAWTPLAIVAAGTLVRLVLAARVPLVPDETYYWEWSRRLAAGYFDHPPAIALLIRAGVLLLGATPLGVRLGAVATGAVASLAIVALARRLAPPPWRAHAGVLAALFTTCVPVALAGFVLATPDAPLLAAIAVTLAAVAHALDAPPGSRATLAWWCAAGLALGVAFCSKYTSVLVPAGVFAAMLLRPSLRARLAEPGPYVAAAIALLVLSPVLAWNAQHHWISFTFQLHHGLGAPRGSPLRREGDLVGGQLGLVSPVLAILGVWATARALRRGSTDGAFVIAVVAAVAAALFVTSALRKPVEANWPAPAVLAALALLAAWPMRDTLSRWRAAGTWIAAALSSVVVLQALWGIVPIPARRDPILRGAGWGALARDVVRLGASTPARDCPHARIAANRYQDASELAFHLPGRPTVLSLNIGSRANQYDLWPTLVRVAAPGDCVVLVADSTATENPLVVRAAASFDTARFLGYAHLRRGHEILGTREVWQLAGYRR